MTKAGRLLKPIEPLLLPQLDMMQESHIDELEKELGSILSREGSKGSAGFNSSTFALQNATCIQNATRNFFSSLAKQIIHTYNEIGGRPSGGASTLQ